ncbi:MAG: 50S ribosomal protein L31e [archaeon]
MSMADITRTYNIPLRKEFQKSPLYRRAKKAVTAVRGFLIKHMKTETVKIGPKLNDLVWKHGIRNPPHHIKVVVIKGDDGVARAELEGFEYPKPIGDKKKSDDKKRTAKPAEKKEIPKVEERSKTEDKPKVEEKAPAKPAEVKKPEVTVVEKKPEAKPAEKPVEKKAPAPAKPKAE